MQPICKYYCLLQGESGTGKSILTRSIHGWSNRSGGLIPLVNMQLAEEATVIESCTSSCSPVR